MKKLTFLACAALLTSAVALTGCKGDQNEPSKKQEEVKTQFAISMPNQLSNGKLRMPSTTVQKDGLTDFQGMDGIILVPFSRQGKILGTDTRLGANITTLSAIVKADIDRPSSAKVYEDVAIPLATSSFLFYAKSALANTTPEQKFIAGSLLPANLTANNPSSFTFSLEQIQNDPGALTLSTANGGKLLKYLNSVANATDGTKKWYEYAAADIDGMKAIFDTYASMHGLSSFEVQRVMTDLYKSLALSSSPIIDAIKDSIAAPAYATVDGSGNVTLESDLQQFPQSFNLPEGSIDIKWDAVSFVVGNYAGMASPDKYVYPAQLWYYVNSQINTSNSSKKTMYDDTNDWAAVLAAHEAARSVNARTRAVAITDAVQYAVARLDLQVRINSSSLEDNSLTMEGEATPVNCSTGFPITAVLIGGQQQVKFDFTTNGGTEYTIYDQKMADAAMKAMPGTTYSSMNHTLVLENGTSDVNVAVEMVNTSGVDFYGAGGQLIPKNGKFYVVGQLQASAATETDNHVFKQDYTTTAKLTLKNLKTAYNTIPDLRTTQLELGFSVDLTWQAGHTYEIDFN